MNISTALRRIKALKGEIARITGLIQVSNTWRADDTPAYNAAELLQQRGELISELVSLKTKLADANSSTTIKVTMQGKEVPMLLITAIHFLEEWKGEISMLEGLMVAPSNDYFETENVFTGENYVTQKVVHHCVITTRERDEKVKNLRERFAALNDIVEAANHTYEI